MTSYDTWKLEGDLVCCDRCDRMHRAAYGCDCVDVCEMCAHYEAGECTIPALKRAFEDGACTAFEPASEDEEGEP